MRTEKIELDGGPITVCAGDVLWVTTEWTTDGEVRAWVADIDPVPQVGVTAELPTARR